MILPTSWPWSSLEGLATAHSILVQKQDFFEIMFVELLSKWIDKELNEAVNTPYQQIVIEAKLALFMIERVLGYEQLSKESKDSILLKNKKINTLYTRLQDSSSPLSRVWISAKSEYINALKKFNIEILESIRTILPNILGESEERLGTVCIGLHSNDGLPFSKYGTPSSIFQELQWLIHTADLPINLNSLHTDLFTSWGPADWLPLGEKWTIGYAIRIYSGTPRLVLLWKDGMTLLEYEIQDTEAFVKIIATYWLINRNATSLNEKLWWCFIA